jgi:hypothetical protein
MTLAVWYYHNDRTPLCIASGDDGQIHPFTMALTECVWFVPGTLTEGLT